MNLEVNNVIILVDSVQKRLVEFYQLQSIGRTRAATDLALQINNDLLQAAVLFGSIALNVVEDDLDSTPQLTLIK